MTNPNPDHENKPSSANKNNKWVFIGIGCVVMAFIGIITAIVLGVVAAFVIPKMFPTPTDDTTPTEQTTPTDQTGQTDTTTTGQDTSSDSDEASEAKALLEQLESGASAYTTSQEISPEDFLDFVTNSPLDDTSAYVVSLQYTGNPTSPPCNIASTYITCSGGTPDSRFPTLPGAVSYSFNTGPGTFTLYCDGGISPPFKWNPETCSVSP